MLLVQRHGAVPCEAVKYTFEHKSSHMHTASIVMLVQTPAVGRVGVQGSVELHSYKTFAGPHGVWWLSPCRSTLRILFNCKAGAVLHPTQVMRVGNSSSWFGQDDKTARIDMTHVSSMARVGPG